MSTDQMRTFERRELLEIACAGLALPLAGCSDDGPEPGLHAVYVLVLHRPGDGWYEYPDEVGVRVTVENTANRRRQGVLVVTVTRTGDGREWTRERDVDMSRGTTTEYDLVVDVGDAAGDDEFEASATIEPR